MHVLVSSIPTGLFFSCSRILIDTGSPDKSDYIKMLKDTLDKYKAELERVIITHWHQDHIGGVKEVWLMNPGMHNSF